MNEKNCIKCGLPLPEEASFCPHCETSQAEEVHIHPPKRYRRMLIAAGVAALCLLALLLFVALHHRPVAYEGSPEVAYSLGGEKLRVFLSYDAGSAEDGHAVASRSDRQPTGSQSAIFSQLFVWGEDGAEAAEAFSEQMQDCRVSAIPRDDAQQMDVSAPYEGENGSVQTATVIYSAECGTNEICWDIAMKNGDTIRLTQEMTCELLPTLEYHCEDTPLGTIDEIEAVFRDAESEEPGAIIHLYLPPVTYEGNLNLTGRSACIHGSESGGQRTTFTDTVTVGTRSPQLAEFHSVAFLGDGGVGLAAREGVILDDCSFTGWDVGANAEDGSWIIMSDCTFTGNRIGFLFDSQQATCSSDEYRGMTFSENETAVQIRHIPGSIPIRFLESTFSGNGEDLDDPDGLVQIG